MENLDFLFDCLLSLSIVFVILTILALSMRLLTYIFVDNIRDDDSPVIAAITSHLSRVYPQLQITNVEEQK